MKYPLLLIGAGKSKSEKVWEKVSQKAENLKISEIKFLL